MSDSNFSSNPSLQTDTDLFSLIAKGDETAFTHIFHRYKTRLFEYALRITKSKHGAEELVQDCFLKIWANRSTLTAVDNPQGYLFTIAPNAGIDFLRKLSLDERIQQQVFHVATGDDNATIDRVNLGEAQRLIAEAVAGLAEQQKQVFQLSRQEGLSYDEIAEQLGISSNTVRNHLVRALKHIRTFLADKYGAIVVMILLHFND